MQSLHAKSRHGKGSAGMPNAVVFFNCNGHSLPLINLPDRRTSPPTQNVRWLFQADLERIFYGNEASTGAAYRLLCRAGVREHSLTLRGTSVAQELVTEEEWAELKGLHAARSTF